MAVGLTQAEVASEVGVRRRAVWAWEKGESLPTSSQSIPKLATLFGVSPSFLLHGTVEPSVEFAAMRLLIVDEMQMLRDDLAKGLASIEGSIDELTKIVRGRSARRNGS
jgi:transcriptional regulator with XRE-family HTH domain